MADKDYARELAEKWNSSSEPRSEMEAIEGAVREALAKAAEIAERQCSCDDHAFGCTGLDVSKGIRALGAKP